MEIMEAPGFLNISQWEMSWENWKKKLIIKAVASTMILYLETTFFIFEHIIFPLFYPTERFYLYGKFF